MGRSKRFLGQISICIIMKLKELDLRNINIKISLSPNIECIVCRERICSSVDQSRDRQMIGWDVWCKFLQVRLNIGYCNVVALLKKPERIGGRRRRIDIGEFVQCFPAWWSDVYATTLNIRRELASGSRQLRPVLGHGKVVG